MKSYEDWFHSPDVRPYVFVRKENLPAKPGSFHDYDFPKAPLIKEPLFLKEAAFANQILRLENRCFQSVGMILPRWVFYDCSLIPGIAVGFAHKAATLPSPIRKIMPIDDSLEYIPLSLFIAIPTADGHWVAHNLCSVSSIVSADDRLPYLGFLTKAFGLHYFNIQNLYGMTQWGSQAIKVHSNYGEFRIISAYNEIHDYPETLTYLVKVESPMWKKFVADEPAGLNKKRLSRYVVHQKDKTSMKALQTAIEAGEGPFYLDSKDFADRGVEDQIPIYL